MVYQLLPHQREAYQFAAQRLLSLKSTGLLLDPGLGKTGTTLRLIDYLSCVVGMNCVLITAPSKVLSHWSRESENFGCVLPIHVLDGTPKNREQLLRRNHGVYVVSHDLLKWVYLRRQLFDLFVIDESNKFRNWESKRTVAARRLASGAKYRMILTGSPAPNCPSEMFAQHFILDRGITLGTTLTEFRNVFMHRGGFENREWLFDEELRETFNNAIAPWYIRQDKELLGTIPPLSYNEIRFDLPKEAKEAYKEFERQLYYEWMNGDQIVAFGGSQRYNLCRQLAGGFYYDGEDKTPRDVHTAKAELLRDLIDGTNDNVLVAYNYRYELDIIRRICGPCPAINGDTTNKQTEQIIKEWQAGEHKFLAAQSQAISHGVDGLQHGSSTLVWYSLTDFPDAHDQLISRLHRTGQTKRVIVHYLIAKGTVDSLQLRRIRDKLTQQAAMMEYFRTQYLAQAV